MITEIAVTVIGTIVSAAILALFARLWKAKAQIDKLSFLVSHMLTIPEKEHLRKIESREVFEVDTRENFKRFNDEISRLYNLGFITYHRDKHNQDLFREGEPYLRRVDEHCEIKKPGRVCLDLLAEVAKSSN